MNETKQSELLDKIKDLVTYLGGISAIGYVVGFIIVTTNMWHYGIGELSLLNTRYVSAGLFFLFLLALTLVPASYSITHLAKLIIEHEEMKPIAFETKKDFNLVDTLWNFLWSIDNFKYLYFMILSFISAIVPLFIIHILSRWAWTGQTSTLSEMFNALLSEYRFLLPNWFIPLYIVAPILFSVISKRYLFSWDEVPGNDSVKLIEFLKQKFGIGWVETAKIKKIDDGRNIRVTVEKNYLSLGLNNEKTEVNLKIDDVRSAEFTAKSENGKLKIYSKRNENENSWLFGLFGIPSQFWIIGGTIIAFFFAVNSYAIEIYPHITPAVGGGDAVEVRLVAEKETVDTLKEMVPFETNSTTVSLRLLDQNDKAYFVLVPDPENADAFSHAVQIDKSLVYGVIYARPST